MEPTRKFKDSKFFKFIQIQGQDLPFFTIFVLNCIVCLNFYKSSELITLLALAMSILFFNCKRIDARQNARRRTVN